MIPDFRTGAYGIWRTCERFNILPPGVKPKWEDMDPWSQCLAIGYDQIRQYEEASELQMLTGAKML